MRFFEEPKKIKIADKKMDKFDEQKIYVMGTLSTIIIILDDVL